MSCMKCGVETPETQVFCDHCLELMKAHPVKPGTRIHLPKRALITTEAKKPAKKKKLLSPDEQITVLKLRILRMRLAIVILVFIVCVVSAFLGLKIYDDLSAPDNTGRNYTIDTSIDD